MTGASGASVWAPRVTVAVVVQDGDRFLMVEESADGGQVLNQPAGHLDPGESLIDAALRECREETAWQVRPTGLVGVYLWDHPDKPLTFLRVTLTAAPEQDTGAPLDPDISARHWLTRPQIAARPLRSPLVLACLDDALARPPAALDRLQAIGLK